MGSDEAAKLWAPTHSLVMSICNSQIIDLLSKLRLINQDLKRSLWDNLPEELETKIFLLLPVKSLLRCKSVCKSWNSVISSDEFVNEHLKVSVNKSKRAYSSSSSTEPTQVIGWGRRDPNQGKSDILIDRNQIQTVSLVTIMGDLSSITTTFKEYVPHCRDTKFNISLPGSHCNGLLCLADHTSRRQRVLFYNPALREYKLVMTSSPEINYCYVGFGFGYDPKTDDYKFVRMMEGFPRWRISKAEIYSLRTGAWRKIEFNIRDFWLLSGVYFNGHYYWINLADRNLISFDMTEEKFSTVNLPVWYDGKASPPYITVWKESLAYVITGPRLGRFKMWVMDGQNRWVKHFKIKNHMINLIAFWKEDEAWMEDIDHRLWSYNLKTKKCRLALPLDDTMRTDSAFSDLYVESLVSVKSTKMKLTLKNNYKTPSCSMTTPHLDLSFSLGLSLSLKFIFGVFLIFIGLFIW